MHHIRTPLCFFCLGLLVATHVGCGQDGPRTYRISGTVTFDGNPVQQGDIFFVPENRSLAPDATKIIDGEFAGRAKEGLCRVEITALNIGPDTPVMMGSHLAENFIPEKYNTESELSANVSPDSTNTYEFALVSTEPASSRARENAEKP